MQLTQFMSQSRDFFTQSEMVSQTSERILVQSEGRGYTEHTLNAFAMVTGSLCWPSLTTL